MTQPIDLRACQREALRESSDGNEIQQQMQCLLELKRIKIELFRRGKENVSVLCTLGCRGKSLSATARDSQGYIHLESPLY